MEHSNVFGFSSAYRLIKCHASRRLSQGEPNVSSPQSELGTAGHALGEHCLRFGFEPHECEGMVFNKHIVDQNMIDAVTVYTSKIRALEALTGKKGMIEQRVTLYSLFRDDVFGTSDYILIDGRTMYIADYKHGYVTVDIVDNHQFIGYAMACMDTFDLWDKIDTVKTFVVQPRASHVDGPVREYSYTTRDLRVNWWGKYYEAVTQGEKSDSPATPGEHCKYCPASGYCRARINYALNMIATDTVHHEVMSDDEIEFIYNEIGSLKRTLDKVEERALSIARKGHSFQNHKLVKAIVRAKVPEGDKEKAFIEKVRKLKGDDAVSKLYYPPKLIGMTAAKKIAPKDVVDKYYEKPQAGYTLVPMSDSRPALSQKKSAAGVFESII